MKKYGLILLGLLLVWAGNTHAVVTTSGWDTIEWHISGFSDADIDRAPGGCVTGHYNVVYYWADIPVGRMLDIEAVCTPLKYEGRHVSRVFDISIPNAGTRYITRKTVRSGFMPVLPIPDTIENRNRGKFSPYQKVPPYPDSRFQPDKWILIGTSGYTALPEDEPLIPSYGYTLIYVRSRTQMASGEALPEYVDYEPAEVINEPYGCNGCSSMGLPGFRIDMQSLGLVVQDRLFAYESMGPDVDVELTYRSGETNHSAFGKGWRLNMDQWLSLDESGVSVQRGDNSIATFPVTDTGEVAGDSVVITNAVGESAFTNVYAYHPAPNGDKVVYSNCSDKTWTVLKRHGYEKEIYARGTNNNAASLPMKWLSDWNGNAVRIDRNAADAITQLVDAVGRKTQFQLSTAGYCTNIVMPSGETASFGYDEQGQQLWSVDLIGNRTDYSYAAVLTNMSTEGRSWGFNWMQTEGQWRILGVENPLEQTAAYTNFYGGRTTAQDFSGNTYEFTADEGRKETSTRPDATEINGYNSFGFPTNVTMPTSGKRTVVYDTNGLRTAYQDANQYGWNYYGYSSNGLLTSLTNTEGGVWRLSLDDMGNVLSVTSPAGRVVHRTYDAYGRLASHTDGLTNTVLFTYDSLGNVETRVGADGAVARFGYDTNGINKVSETDENGNMTRFEYDANRRLTRITYADGTSRQFKYDCCAQTGIINERGDERSITRDVLLRPVAETDYMGKQIVRRSFDGEGRLLTKTDALGHTFTQSYDSLGRVVRLQEPNGNQIERTYSFSQSFTLTPTETTYTDYGGTNRQPQAKFSFHGEGQLYQTGNSYTFYDGRGLLIRKTRPSFEGDFFDKTHQIYYQYDPDGLLTSKLYGTVQQFSRSYDAAMNLRSISHAEGTDRYTPDAVHQIVQIDYHDGLQVKLNYDPVGNQTNLVYPGGQQVQTEYDSRNRPVRISWGSHWMNVQYDAAGCVTGELHSNGTGYQAAFNANSALTGYQHARTGQVMVAMSLERNDVGNITTAKQTAGLTPMYPVMAQIQQGLAYTPDFEVRTMDGQSAGSDKNYNLTNCPALGFSASYNLEGWPTSLQVNGEALTFSYGDTARPIKIVKDGQTRYYHYGPDGNLLVVADQSGQVLQQFVYLGSVPVAMLCDNDVYWYHYDHRGCAQFLTDSLGRIAAVYKYRPYGEQAGSYSRVENPFTFGGRYGVLDWGQGLYGMGARVYFAKLRRFLSPDPAGYGAGVNWMTYADNDPIGRIDPGGFSGIPADYYSRGYQRENFHGPGYYTHTAPRKSNVKVDTDGCYSTAENLAASLSQKAGGFKILRELYEGQYGDAMYDVVGMGLKGAGTFYSFMMQPGNAGSNYDRERELEKQLGKQAEEHRKKNYFNEHDSGGYGGFTVDEPTFPPFSLDD